MTFATETVKIWTINTTTSCHNKPHYLVVVRDNIWFSDTAFRIIFYLSTTVCLACFPLSLCPFFWLLRKIKESHSPILPPNGGEKYSLISLLFFGNNANIFVFVTEYLLFVFPSLTVVGPLMLSILARGLLSDCTYRGGRRTGWKHLWGNINISCEDPEPSYTFSRLATKYPSWSQLCAQTRLPIRFVTCCHEKLSLRFGKKIIISSLLVLVGMIPWYHRKSGQQPDLIFNWNSDRWWHNSWESGDYCHQVQSLAAPRSEDNTVRVRSPPVCQQILPLRQNFSLISSLQVISTAGVSGNRSFHLFGC